MQIDLMHCQLKCAINLIWFALYYWAIGVRCRGNATRYRVGDIRGPVMSSVSQLPIEFAAMSMPGFVWVRCIKAPTLWS